MSDISTREIADKLVGYCRSNDTQTGLNELYDPNAVSVEAMPMPGQESAETNGVEGIRGKHVWWETTFEVHSANVDGPYMHGDDRFGVIFEIDATNRETNERNAMNELAIYHVAGGKIVREEFFYTM